jgi:hypothetical protein
MSFCICFKGFKKNASRTPPAAKEKLLKKFLFGISSKLFTGRRAERCRAPLRDASCKSIWHMISLKTFSNIFSLIRAKGRASLLPLALA